MKSSDVEAVFRSVDEARVRYIVMGGLAVVQHVHRDRRRAGLPVFDPATGKIPK